MAPRVRPCDERVATPISHRSDRKYFRPRSLVFQRKTRVDFVGYGDRRARAPHPAPRTRDRGRAAQLRGRRPAVPRRRDRRRRLPRVPAQPGHLRPAPGRPQPDAAGEDPLRQGRARPARDARPHRRDLLAGLGPPHHPPERPVPLRAARDSRRGAAAPRVGRAHQPRGVRRHRAQRHRLPPRRRVPLRGARHQPVGRGDEGPLPAQPDRAAPAPQVQDQLLRLRHRLRPGDVQRRRRDRGEPPASRRHRRARLPGVHGRRPRREPAPGAGARGVHLAGGPPPHHRGDPAGAGPPRQPRQQAAGPHEVAGRHHGRSTSCASASSRSASSCPRRPRTRVASPTIVAASRATRPPAWAPR